MSDLKSVPPSPRNPVSMSSHALTSNPASAQASRQTSTPASRRTSQIYPMSPPPLPLASPSGNISSTNNHTHTMSPHSPSLSGNFSSVDASGVPIRHPRPLTAAELHLELEKEQEAVVNRLTRELSALRAHSASVVSTTSSVTSGVHIDQEYMSGAANPTSARRHRSSSSVSRNSAISHNQATTSVPHRYSVSSQQNHVGDVSAAHQTRSASVVSTPRYEEVAHYRQELEEAKRENETLKKRIRDLERALKNRSEVADGQRGRTRAPTSEVSASQPARTSEDNANPVAETA